MYIFFFTHFFPHSVWFPRLSHIFVCNWVIITLLWIIWIHVYAIYLFFCWWTAFPGLPCYKGLLWTILGGSPSAVALAMTICDKINLHQNQSERTAFIKRGLAMGTVASELSSSLLVKWLGYILLQTSYLLQTLQQVWGHMRKSSSSPKGIAGS